MPQNDVSPRPEKPPKQKWAGHGHVGKFLLQVGALIAVNLGIWFFVFLMALRLSGEPMPWED